MGQPVRLFMAAQAGFIVVALAPMFVLGTQLVTPFGDPSVLEEVRPSLQGLAEIGINLPHIVAIVGLAALLMGCTFPLANAHVQRVAASVGGRAGGLVPGHDARERRRFGSDRFCPAPGSWTAGQYRRAGRLRTAGAHSALLEFERLARGNAGRLGAILRRLYRRASSVPWAAGWRCPSTTC